MTPKFAIELKRNVMSSFVLFEEPQTLNEVISLVESATVVKVREELVQQQLDRLVSCAILEYVDGKYQVSGD